MQNRIKTKKEIENMRKSGKILAQVIEFLIESTKPGMTTLDLDSLANQKLEELGGKPVFLGYYGFPGVLCVSVNDEVIHGIPNARKVINEGDIVSVDFGVNYNGMITDSARTFVVGNTNSAEKLLIQKTEQALLDGISVVKSRTYIGDISAKIEHTLKKAGLGIVRDYVGHGVGHELHEAPDVPNYGKAGTGFVLEAGMTIAIEPMATLGGDRVYTDVDGWTVKTADRSRAAHFEDTVLVTQDGYEILTRLD